MIAGAPAVAAVEGRRLGKLPLTAVQFGPVHLRVKAAKSRNDRILGIHQVPCALSAAERQAR